MTHAIAVLALPGVIPFELGMPSEVFGRVAVPDEPQPYRVRVCGSTRRVYAGDFSIALNYDLGELSQADTIVVPGIADAAIAISPDLLGALGRAAERGTRIASICSGAFVLAAAGLLDGLRATTHWRAARLLAERYPRVSVDPNVLYVDNGQILTSAGASAGMDLCLHMVRLDYGGAVAADAARLAVMPIERDGGQAQYIVHEPLASDVALGPLLAWMAANVHRPLGLDAIAARAGMSTRTLGRHFRAQTGTTPLQWLLTCRVRRAQEILQSTGLPIEEVATRVGFESAATLRERFSRQVGASPSTYRRTFRGGAERAPF